VYSSDPLVREHGVRALSALSEGQLMTVWPQLVQALCFEMHHESALARMLLQRALQRCCFDAVLVYTLTERDKIARNV